tara:strand:+ start:4062 stop:4511 length:450 start_codon:yes stop_codon:yes gene_type:complete
MPLVGDELWNAIGTAVSNWRAACDDKEGQALLSYLTSDKCTVCDQIGLPERFNNFGFCPRLDGIPVCITCANVIQDYMDGLSMFDDELEAWLDKDVPPLQEAADKQISEVISLTHLNGADSWQELVYALAGEVVDLQGTLDDINNGRDL